MDGKLLKRIGIVLGALVGCFAVMLYLDKIWRRDPAEFVASIVMVFVVALLLVWENRTVEIRRREAEIESLKDLLEFVGLEEKDTRHLSWGGSHAAYAEKIARAMGILSLEEFLRSIGLDVEDVERLKSTGFDPELDADLIAKIQGRLLGK